MMTEIKDLNGEIALLNEDCAKLEEELLKKQQKIADVKREHHSKMEV